MSMSMCITVRVHALTWPCAKQPATQVYDSAEYTSLKGSRLRLESGASVSADGAVLLVTACDEKSSVAQETITQSYTSVSVTAKFKAEGEAEAVVWAEQIQKAIDGA